MYLKSLEISGFKSFAKKSTLHFTSPITGIVGPNGSGKSNTAEAFRFVLGEQSIKSLRGKRGEDMIWNGGGEAGRANRASVKLVFDNSRRIFANLDYDEVVIERAVHRDNTNEYFLNGSQVRLKDIQEMLAGAHIGSSGHQIISQGEADRILSASIGERREMIEDALGLRTYQWKKIESQKKLGKTEENMKQVESLRREIAPHIKFLKKQVEKVEKAEELRNELTRDYQEYFFISNAYMSAEKSRLEPLVAKPRIRLTELDRELLNAKNILSQSERNDAKSKEVIELQTKLSDLRFRKGEIMRDLGRLEGEIGAYSRAIEREKDKQKSDETKTVYLRDVEQVLGGAEALAASSEEPKVIVGRILELIKSFVSKHKVTIDSRVVNDAEKEMAAARKTCDELSSRLEAVKREENSTSEKYDTLRTAIEKEKDTNREAEKNIFKIIAEQNEVRHSLNSFEAEMAKIRLMEENLKREMGEAGMLVGRAALSSEGRPPISEVRPRTLEAIEDIRRRIERNKVRLEDSGVAGATEIMKEFRETEERDVFLGRELEDLEKAKTSLLNLIAELDARIDFEFKNGIFKINAEFDKYFKIMFGGGKAELTVVREIKRKRRSDLEVLRSDLEVGPRDVNEDDETEEGLEGLDVSVSLPRKKVKGLMMLSGGERALTSIALLFAVSQVNPPPFIVLDETDAALDEANSKKYGDMIENLSSRSQLILITHNRETMSHSGVIYGVTMGQDGSSRLLSIAFDDAVKVAK
jgi:chromosome segregation protein